jgi:hypothetical protein
MGNQDQPKKPLFVVKEIHYHSNRSIDYEGGKFGIVCEVPENISKDSLNAAVDKIIDYVEGKADEVEKRTIERQKNRIKEREEEEMRKEKMLKNLPRSKEEALDTPIDESGDEKIKDLSITKLTDLKDTFDNNTPIGRAVRIVLGEVNPSGKSDAEELAEPTKPSNSYVSDSYAKDIARTKVPSHVTLMNPGNRTLDDANEAELNFIAKELRRGSPELKENARKLLQIKFGK